MLNQVIVVGRIADKIEVKELENGKKVASITLAVPRSFRDESGDYETDFITANVYNSVASNISEYCEKGDCVGIKGRLTRLNGEELSIVAEKVTFLSSRKSEEDE